MFQGRRLRLVLSQAFKIDIYPYEHKFNHQSESRFCNVGCSLSITKSSDAGGLSNHLFHDWLVGAWFKSGCFFD